MVSHAANCVPLRVGTSRYRIYFSSRDALNRASIGWVEIDLRNPLQVLAISSTPALGPGPPGAFDDSGTSAACLLLDGGVIWIYYTGWNLGLTVPWRNAIGVAMSTDGIVFERYSPAPILDRSRVDPYSLSYPFVLREDDAWHMWYGSNLRWGSDQRDMDHVIKYARGSDATTWQPTGLISIGIESADEYAFSRPSVLRDGAVWKMWYSYRGAAYRIGYAESADGMRWKRLDGEAGIEPAADDWDSESVEYPYVFDHENDRYMLYNGRRYGLTGFGIAVLDSD